MYNTEKMIQNGEKIMMQNGRRDITTKEMNELHDSGDDWDRIRNAFLLGVAVGERIGKAERA